MKKLLLFLLLSLSISVSAQKVYTIENPLVLKTVNAGTIGDDVLLRNSTDKTVKKVSWTDFLSAIPTTSQVNADWNSLSGPAMIMNKPTIPILVSVSNSQAGIVDNTSLQELGGVDKTINGVRVGKGGGTAVESTAVGSLALGSNTTGNNNIAVGYEVLKSNTTGYSNSGIGSGALKSNTTGYGNSAVGNGALASNISANNNIAFGNGALASNQAGNNSAVGALALFSNTTGINNSALGKEALTNNTTGSNNSVVGSLAFKNNITGGYNSAVGTASMGLNTTGSHNNAIGYGALNQNTIGSYNTVFGSYSGYYATGSNNTALGNLTLSSVSTITGTPGVLNIAIGSRAGRYITTGSGNIVISSSSDEGGITTALSSGSNNIIISPNDNNTSSGVTTGSGNTLIGRVTGLTGSIFNTVILADGVGTPRLVSNSSNLTSLPAQTKALIEADFTGKGIITKEYLDSKINTTIPSSATDTGTIGEIRVCADGYVYWCVATNTWIRALGTTW